MSEPVRNLGHVVTMAGGLATVGVDHDVVVVTADSAAFTCGQAEEFAHLYLAACWEAARYAGRMAAENTEGAER